MEMPSAGDFMSDSDEPTKLPGLPEFEDSTHERLSKMVGDIAQAQKIAEGPMDRVRNMIAAQRKALDSINPQGLLPSGLMNDIFKERPGPDLQIQVPTMPKIRNPIIETNARLEQLEEHFEKMLTVMTNAAAIGTTIQEHASEFLVKFERVSQDTDRSASRAIRISVAALFIALMTPFLQMGYDATKAYYNPDQTDAKLGRVVEELVTLRQADTQATERLIGELQQSSKGNADKLAAQLRADGQASRDLLKDIQRLLAESPRD
jgi:hypothetical protein